MNSSQQRHRNTGRSLRKGRDFRAILCLFSRASLYIRNLTFASVTAFLLTSALAALGQDFVTNTYTISTEDLANPERGFYIQSDSYASSPSPVPNNLASYRIFGKSSPGNTYTAKISLLMRVYYLDTFVDAPVSSNFLNSIQEDFDSVRDQGCKMIVRFAYNQDQTRPFNEPTKARILSKALGTGLKVSEDCPCLGAARTALRAIQDNKR